MKKINYFLGTVVLTAMVLTSCEKNPNGDEGKGTEPGGQDLEITIDGNFNDWANITESSEDGTVYVDNSISSDFNALKVLKMTSDESYIYVYTEIASDKIYTDSNIGRGDSYTGTGGKNPAPGPLWIYLDVDNDAETGFYTHGVTSLDDYIFNNMGCEHALSLYLIRPVETGTVDMSWSQTNQFVAGVDNGAEIDKAHAWPTTDPNGKDGYGWSQANDNTHVTYDNFKAGTAGTVVPVEFAISRATVTADYSKAGQTFKVAVAYQSGDATGKWTWTGRIPSNGKAFELKLK